MHIYVPERILDRRLAKGIGRATGVVPAVAVVGRRGVPAGWALRVEDRSARARLRVVTRPTSRTISMSVGVGAT